MNEHQKTKEWQAFKVPMKRRMPAARISFIEAKLREAKCFLEYGAGGSTMLAASLGVRGIISAESDKTLLTALKSISPSRVDAEAPQRLRRHWPKRKLGRPH